MCRYPRDGLPGFGPHRIGSPGLTQLNPQSAISQLEALGYNVQVNVGTVYVDANCPEGDDYFRSTDSLRIASSSVSSRLQKAKRTR